MWLVYTKPHLASGQPASGRCAWRIQRYIFSAGQGPICVRFCCSCVGFGNPFSLCVAGAIVDFPWGLCVHADSSWGFFGLPVPCFRISFAGLDRYLLGSFVPRRFCWGWAVWRRANCFGFRKMNRWRCSAVVELRSSWGLLRHIPVWLAGASKKNRILKKNMILCHMLRPLKARSC